MINNFIAFLLKQNIISLALAVVVGTSLNTLVKAVVDDLIMPVILSVAPGGDWQKTIWEIGPIKLGVGHFLGAVINFMIISLLAWQLTRLFIKADKATKECVRCKLMIDATATRCPNCTSELAAV